ncbi:MAG: hypothetical protein HY617_01830 [Candidatus Sungbacteria bacterium]|nr:hypothetical protein [Candidatus Sungbacteria bacterium]
MTDEAPRTEVTIAGGLSDEKKAELRGKLLREDGTLKPIVVTRLTESHQIDVMRMFIRGVYGFWYKSLPVGDPEVSFAAFVVGEEIQMIIGTLGWNTLEKTHSHLIYVVEPEMVPGMGGLKRGVEFTRFGALNSMPLSMNFLGTSIPKGAASIPLLLAAVEAALVYGFTHGFHVTIPKIAERMIGLGIDFRHIPEAKVNQALVRELAAQDPYYATEPLPGLYVTSLVQERDALLSHVKQMIAEKKLKEYL